MTNSKNVNSTTGCIQSVLIFLTDGNAQIDIQRISEINKKEHNMTFLTYGLSNEVDPFVMTELACRNSGVSWLLKSHALNTDNSLINQNIIK